jgi:hypothetical protein
MGGPIVRNKAFFFFNYEGTRIKQGLSRISTVPLDNEPSATSAPMRPPQADSHRTPPSTTSRSAPRRSTLQPARLRLC